VKRSETKSKNRIRLREHTQLQRRKNAFSLIPSHRADSLFRIRLEFQSRS